VRDNNHFDCVPVIEQPSVRALGLKVITSPPPAVHDFSDDAGQDSIAGARPVTVTSQFDPEQPFDEFGNATPISHNCEREKNWVALTAVL
jgi:hypothetical protein